MNLKKVAVALEGRDMVATVRLNHSGEGVVVTAGDFELPQNVEIANPEQHIANGFGARALLQIEALVARGLRLRAGKRA